MSLKYVKNDLNSQVLNEYESDGTPLADIGSDICGCDDEKEKENIGFKNSFGVSDACDNELNRKEEELTSGKSNTVDCFEFSDYRMVFSGICDYDIEHLREKIKEFEKSVNYKPVQIEIKMIQRLVEVMVNPGLYVTEKGGLFFTFIYDGKELPGGGKDGNFEYIEVKRNKYVYR